MPLLASHVAINSFFRVHESVANEEEKKELVPRLPSPPLHFSPAGEMDPKVKMDHVNREPENMLKTDALEMSAHGSRHHGGGRWWQLTSQPWNLPAGLSDTVQSSGDLRHMQRRNKRNPRAMEKGAKREEERTNKTEARRWGLGWRRELESPVLGPLQQPQTSEATSPEPLQGSGEELSSTCLLLDTM